MFKEMRRTDRQITDTAQIAEIIRECEIIHLGFKDGDGMYIVPLHFGIGGSAEAPVFYTHSAAEGHKMDLIGDGCDCAFEMECGIKLVEAEMACGFTSEYKSVIGDAYVSIVADDEEKKAALLAIMDHYTEGEWEIPDKILPRVGVLKIEVKDMTCKMLEM